MAVTTARIAMFHAADKPSTLSSLPLQQQLQSRSLNPKTVPSSTVTITRLLLFLQLIPTCWALTCMTCAAGSGTHQDAIQLDKFRVTAQLSRPSCSMEPIRCDRDQDVCVTITMHIGGGHYWIGAGCDRHEQFQHTACENVRTLTRNVQLGMVHERRALQRVCVCAFDRCNTATRTSYSLPEFHKLPLPYISILICSFIILYICNNIT